MRLSFVIPAHNEENYVGNCISSIQKDLERSLREAEIIVINNASTDRTAEAARKYKNVRVIDEPTKGLVYARQRGLKEASGDLLAYLDADCLLKTGWIETVFSEFKNPLVVALSGPRRYYDMPAFKKFLADHGWWFAPVIYRLVGYMLLGGNFVARRDTLEKMGGFDTSIKFYGEDTDIARRLHELGRVVFRMDFFVYSSGRRLMEEGVFKTYWVYAVNFIWEVIFKKPFTKHYQDVR
ncbi:MAG: glycosyltransferase family A protein [Candidatus Liptonbacteria bacterium]|nr:glycosyltransferase family A protein [Candidatus Liptonbacteria bacterium]